MNDDIYMEVKEIFYLSSFSTTLFVGIIHNCDFFISKSEWFVMRDEEIIEKIKIINENLPYITNQDIEKKNHRVLETKNKIDKLFINPKNYKIKLMKV